MLFNLFIFLISCIVLAFSSKILVKRIVKLEKFLKVSDFSIGFILMAVATTLPELFVGINSAIKNNTALSLGNVLGSNIVNLTLILGLVIILSKGIKTENLFVKKNTFYLLIISLLPLIMMLDHIISRTEGIILLLIFIFYIYNLTKQKLPKTKEIYKNTEAEKDFLYFIIGITLLITSSDFVVRYGSKLAIDLFIPPILIGLFMVAIGTSLPELVFGIRSALSKHPKLSFGNLAGAVIMNSTLVLGATAVIRPITADFTLFLVASIFLIITILLFTIFTKTNKRLSTKEGIILILVYIAFLITEFMLK